MLRVEINVLLLAKKETIETLKVMQRDVERQELYEIAEAIKLIVQENREAVQEKRNYAGQGF